MGCRINSKQKSLSDYFYIGCRVELIANKSHCPVIFFSWGEQIVVEMLFIVWPNVEIEILLRF